MSDFKVGDIIFNKKYRTIERIIINYGNGDYAAEIISSSGNNSYHRGHKVPSYDFHGLVLWEIYDTPLYKQLLEIDIDEK